MRELPDASMASGDLIVVHSDPATIDAQDWNALLQAQAHPTPFMRHEYLAALHTSLSAVPDTGWAPRFVTLHRGGRLAAAAPAYLKSHSWGEYVFDWAWADAYQRHGLRYYPKLLVAVPFTPVPGSRLLAKDDAARSALVRALAALARDAQVSSAHLLFHDAADAAIVSAAGWLERHGLQFHWTQDPAAPHADFNAFLATLQHDKRKKIHQDRRKVAAAGVHFTVHEGAAIDSGLWDFFHHCYLLTYQAHRSTPYLRRDFFGCMAATMASNWVMFVARRGATPIGASLVAIDRARGRAWGRYWGCTEVVSCLHFEACYYQPLQWCIEQGLVGFEGGAQGEHKMARGLLPVATRSAHWLAHPEFARAVQEFLQREGTELAAHVDELHDHSPFKQRSA